jgi:hypothetical protein
MTKETIRDHIPWDDVEYTRDKRKIYHTKVDSTGIHDLVNKLQDEVTKLDFRLHGIRDEIDELEARSLQNVLTKQSKR